MGYAHADIELSNPRLPSLAKLAVRAMANAGALTLCIREHVRLQLKEVEKREVTVADSCRTLIFSVGPVQVWFKNRSCFVGALVLGDEVLLGTVPMADMDLVVNPGQTTVEVNPQSPNFPQALAK